MSHILSDITDLPRSCKSAAEHMARELEREDAFADLPGSCCRRITELEQELEKETGEKIALVAYRV